MSHKFYQPISSKNLIINIIIIVFLSIFLCNILVIFYTNTKIQEIFSLSNEVPIHLKIQREKQIPGVSGVFIIHQIDEQINNDNGLNNVKNVETIKQIKKKNSNSPFGEIVVNLNEHSPEYGDFLQRAQGKLRINLLDSHGKKLKYGRFRSVKLWRIFNKTRIIEKVTYGKRKSLIASNGIDDLGLEPGEYELEIEAGPYGAFRHSFSLASDQHLQEELYTPNYLRIITIHLKNQDNEDIKDIEYWPRYYPEDEILDKKNYKTKMETVLKNPHTNVLRGSGLIGLIGGGGGRGCSWRRRENFKYLTDGGKIHLEVIAGAQGKIVLTLDKKKYGKDKLELTGTFSENKWKHHIINIKENKNENAASLKLSEKYVILNPENPGNRNLFSNNSKPLTSSNTNKTFNWYDEYKLPEKYNRLILYPGNEQKINIIAKKRFKSDAKKVYGARVKKVEDFYIVDWAPSEGNYLEVQVQHDNCKFLTPYIIDPAEGRIVKRDLNNPSILLNISFSVTPTLLAMMEKRSWVKLNDFQNSELIKDGNSFGLIYSIPTANTFHNIKPEYLEMKISNNNEWFKNFKIFKNKSVRSGSYSYFKYSSAININEKFKVPYLNLKKTTIKYSLKNILVFKVVGDQGEGLPWVEGTIISEEDEESSSKIRRMNTKDTSYEQFDINYVPKRISLQYDKFLKEEKLLSENASFKKEYQYFWENIKKMRNFYKEETLIKYFYTHGAWYNTHQKIFSDPFGYVLKKHDLKPGKKYILYLWSKSRDGLYPDKRIEFTVDKNITDLGLISLSSY